MAATRIPLPHLRVEIQRRTGRKVRVGYSRLWSLAVEGRIPAHLDGKRWFVVVSDLSEVVAALGLAPATEHASSIAE